MKKPTAENLRVKLRIHESRHIRAWLSGDQVMAAKHRHKISELKKKLIELEAA
jgi:hypothetical protein